jgi:hypothetical protein
LKEFEEQQKGKEAKLKGWEEQMNGRDEQVKKCKSTRKDSNECE